MQHLRLHLSTKTLNPQRVSTPLHTRHNYRLDHQRGRTNLLNHQNTPRPGLEADGQEKGGASRRGAGLADLKGNCELMARALKTSVSSMFPVRVFGLRRANPITYNCGNPLQLHHQRRERSTRASSRATEKKEGMGGWDGGGERVGLPLLLESRDDRERGERGKKERNGCCRRMKWPESLTPHERRPQLRREPDTVAMATTASRHPTSLQPVPDPTKAAPVPDPVTAAPDATT
uniref:Uncharacterized protein n=1 Tax=Oryza rufipogon TaxID=4529 RepID=A0A0E0NXD6_ORYRU